MTRGEWHLQTSVLRPTKVAQKLSESLLVKTLGGKHLTVWIYSPVGVPVYEYTIYP